MHRYRFFRKWLSDDRNYAALPEEDVEWGRTDWGPRTVVAGWKYWAIVLPSSFFDKVSHSQIEETFANFGVIVKVFTDPDKAMAWLEAR